MVKIILKGGLGNQMFQYAAAKSLALDLKTDLYLDLSFLKCRPPVIGFTIRNFELDLFGVKDKSGALTQYDLINKYVSYPCQLIYNRLLNPNVYVEGPNYYAYDSKFHSLKDGVTIEGYFNNPKYFTHHEKDIKEIFNTDKLYDQEFDKIESEIKSRDSVSINIRRGDYLNIKNKSVFTYLDEEYYTKAISIIRSKVENPHFYIFSHDDPQWFQETFAMDSSEYTMVGKEYVGEKFKTYLRLISLCKHNIISNSTFPWWGAYLNKNPEKIVISPKRWMFKYDFEVLPEWITIDNG